jgi:polyphosphate kinase
MPARKKAEPLFLNRELSLLQFNERVLAMAERSDTPLLERLRYVCIVSSNLKRAVGAAPYVDGP